MKTYTLIFVITFLLPVFLVTRENIIGDIRWHFPQYNTKTKTPWDNEKTSKINLLFNSSNEVDCLLLGSSRATLMDTDPFNCFNLSFSASIGQISELVEYYEYYLNYFPAPKHLAVEIGEFNFQGPASTGTPDFVSKKEKPRSWFEDYISIHTLIQTRKIFTKGSSYFKRSRIYNQDYKAIFNTKRRLKFTSVAAHYIEGKINCNKISLLTTNLSEKNLAYFSMLRNIHSGELTAYLSPLSPDRILNFYYAGQLNNYLDIAFEMAKIADHFYDFTIPGAIGSKGETYDGSHFSPSINSTIGDIIFNKNEIHNHGVDLKNENLESYKSKYQKALQSIISAYNLSKNPCTKHP